MRKLSFITLLFAVNLTFAQQQSLPDVPKKVEFAGVTIKLDLAAQDLVKKEVINLLTPQNKYLTDKLERMQWYFPIIEGILEEEEVPDDFKYVAVAESSLLPDAVSPSNAVGFWQIKQSTAQELGLRMDNYVDERKNIFASTRAAALYLKRNNLIYKNWISTLYSYSLGATGVSKSVPSEWAYASEINFDGKTDRYLIKAIANRIAYEYRLNRLRESPYVMVEYKNAKGKNLEDISSTFSIDVSELKKHNSWLLGSEIPKDKEYSVALLVAQENLEEIQNKISRQNELKTGSYDSGFPVLKKITLVTSSDEDPIFYEINGKKGILAKAGDDVASLARSGKLKIKDFLLYNDMSDRDMVEEGKIYYLQKKNRKAQVPHHVVIAGQGLWEISQMYGIRMKNLLKFNRMKTIQRIQKGRVVWMQKKRPKSQPIEYLNEGEQENIEKPPMIENYDSKETKSIPPKDSRKTTEEKPVEKPTDKVVNKPKPKVEEDDSDIVVISDDEKPKEDNRNRPPVKEQPKKETPRETPRETTRTEVPTEKPVVVKKATAGNVHVVEQGQTLYSVARLYNVSVRDLAAWNGFATDEKVRIGQEIIVRNPNSTSSKPSPVVEPKSTPASSIITHEVQKGETMFSISKRYGVTMKQVQEWNGMSDNNIKIGQKLIIKK